MEYHIMPNYNLSSNNLMLNLILKVYDKYVSDFLFSINFREVGMLSVEVQFCQISRRGTCFFLV